jgi:hypothetical protein
MGSGTRPLPRVGFGYQARTHRIQLRVTQDFPQVRLI